MFIKRLILIFVIITAGCDNLSKKQKPFVDDPKTEPAKNTKVVLVFPPGAGAIRISLKVAEQMERDLAKPLSFIIDMALGVSSGSLVASALTFGDPPKNSISTIEKRTSDLVEQVFPHTNKLVEKLINELGFSIAELEAVFLHLLSLGAGAKASILKLIGIFQSAVKKASKREIKPWDLLAIYPEVKKMQSFTTLERAAKLREEIEEVLPTSTFLDERNQRFIAIASSKGQPVFFGPQKIAQFLPGPLAGPKTENYKALIASSAVPGFIKAADDIEFYAQDGSGPNIISDLTDGFSAKGVGFDPSQISYEIFTKQFNKQDLLIIFMGNGAPVDDGFRRKHPFKNGHFQIKSNHRNIMYAAIDTEILDNQGNNIFNLSSFYVSEDIDKSINNAVKKALDSPGYKWAINTLKNIKNN